MCLVKVRQEEDVVVPYRTVVRTRSTSPRRRVSRVSRTSVYRESRPTSSSYVNVVRPPSSTYVVPTPKPLAIPAPQPVPVFVQPSPPPAPPPPPSHHHHTTAHYVEVSPRSSRSSSLSRSDYIRHEREYIRERERRDYSPDSPRYEHYRYVDAPPSESDHYERFTRRERSRSRARSRSRDYAYEPRDGYRETRERVTVVGGDSRHRREYRN